MFSVSTLLQPSLLMLRSDQSMRLRYGWWPRRSTAPMPSPEAGDPPGLGQQAMTLFEAFVRQVQRSLPLSHAPQADACNMHTGPKGCPHPVGAVACTECQLQSTIRCFPPGMSSAEARMGAQWAALLLCQIRLPVCLIRLRVLRAGGGAARRAPPRRLRRAAAGRQPAQGGAGPLTHLIWTALLCSGLFFLTGRFFRVLDELHLIVPKNPGTLIIVCQTACRATT